MMDYTEFYKGVMLKYPFVDPCVEFIRHNENVTFKVTEKGTEDSYLMRIHKPITKNMQGVQNRREAIQSELELLLAWSAQSEWPVQTPFSNLDGDLVSTVVVEGEEVHCSVLEWIIGETMSKEDFTRRETVRSLGERIAHFHQFSQGFKHSTGFIRPDYGLEWVNTMQAKLRSGVEMGIITIEQLHILENTFSLVTERMKGLSTTTEKWGFIHADMNVGNLIRTSRGISFIDFGLSGLGYYAMDVAMGTLFNKKELRDDLLSGYTNIISEKIDIVQLEGFMFLAICGYYAFMVSREEKHKWIREHLPGLMEHFCKPFLEGKTVFYTV